MNTSAGIRIDDVFVNSYLSALVNRFFKILPIREQERAAPVTYMKSLQCEILGAESFLTSLNGDAMLVTLQSILQYMIDTPDCPVSDVRREVFRAISICNKLKERYGDPHGCVGNVS